MSRQLLRTVWQHTDQMPKWLETGTMMSQAKRSQHARFARLGCYETIGDLRRNDRGLVEAYNSRVTPSVTTYRVNGVVLRSR